MTYIEEFKTEHILKELVNVGCYGYVTDYYSGGKGIVLANSKEEARQKVMDAYLKHGYSKNELSELEVWKIEESPFEDAPDVLEVWQ